MKKIITAVSGAFIILIYISFGSCKHEMSNPCQGSVGILSVNTTPAYNGKSTGTISATATPGSDIKFSVDGTSFQDSGAFHNLKAGDYTVVVKNGIGCSDKRAVTINALTDSCYGVTVAVTGTKTDASPNKSDGSITATATGGNGFTYQLNNGTFQPSGSFSNLAAGTYTVTAKNSNGCKGSTQVVVGTNLCAGVTITVTATKTDAGLSQSNGTITVSATGSTGFTYQLNSGDFQTSNTFTGLAAGAYTVTAKNANGCTGSTQVTISTNACLGVTVSVTATKTDPQLNQSNGSIVASATGATGFTYQLNNGSFVSSGTFTGLAAGTYTITAKSTNGCTGSTQITLVGIDPCAGITVAVTATKTNPLLTQSNGSIVASATGGSGFTYQLNTGAFVASGTFTGLAAGTYTITAKNSNGCMGSTTVTLVGIDPCAGITVAVTATKVDASPSQSNGSITASATGGTGFTYQLNSGAFQASGAFSGLAPGTYTVTAKNSNGCTGQTTVVIVTSNPCAGVTIVVTGSKTDANMGQSNGNITASATGGTGFTYQLNNGAFQATGSFTGLAAGTYTVTAKDMLGCTGQTTFTVGTINPCIGITIVVSATKTDATLTQANGTISATATGSTGFTYQLNTGTFQATGNFTGLVAGTYTITAKNANGCTGSTTVTIASIDPCAGVTIVVTATKTDATLTQANGTISATATGSTGFTYQLNGGTAQASGNFTGLVAGTYTVTAKNANGCTGSTTVTVASINPCTGITVVVTATKTDASTGQSNGAISASATGGSGFTYQLNAGAFQASGSFTGLAAGTYTVTAKNSNGCTGSTTVTIATINPCTGRTIVLSPVVTNVVACGGPAGSITINASGSTGFTFSFDGGLTYFATNADTGLATGTYQLAVKDQDGCTQTGQATVQNAPAGPNFTAVKSIIMTSCNTSSCHTDGGASGGFNFDQDCSIVSAWNDIFTAAVGAGATMPTSGPLTTAQQNAISAWVNAGHTYDK